MPASRAPGQRVVVTGLGILSPLGLEIASHWQAVRSGCSGIRAITRFATEGLRTRIAGELPGFDPRQTLEERVLVQMDRFAQMAVVAAFAAMRDAGLDARAHGLDPYRVGAAIGTAQGGRISDEEVMAQYFKSDGMRVRPLGVPLIMPSAATAWVSIQCGAKGASYPLTNACASGLNAIGLAAQLLRAGAPVDVFLAGGSDAPVTRSMLAGWSATRATSARNDTPQQACRPFDRDRDGMVVSEGAAVLVLERQSHAERRSARIRGEVLGYGATCDAGDLALPDASGASAAEAIGAALRDAGVLREEIGYVSAHGTATRANDPAETRALERAFGEHSRRLAVSALKSMLGHTMGAAGAVESATALLALENGTIPPTINYTTPDPECDLDYVPGEARPHDGRCALVNSFAFGGANAALVLARWE
jgi:3-oxoacyl-[acyl-carrier-protein] synthase II